MADVDKLIEDILAKSKFAAKKGGEGKLYRDEPIIFTAKKLEKLTPPSYRAMRKIAEGVEAHRKSVARIFYEQGKFMEDFEDDFEFSGHFARYFPNYQIMNLEELRGYFSWRTRLKRGQLEKTQTSFAFVYIYELLNQIGVKSAEEGFFALKNFWRQYRELDYQIDRYVETWLRDYVVYNNLDKALLAEITEPNTDTALLVLMDYRAHPAEEVLAALNSVSRYNLENSRFYKQRPEDFREIARDVFAQFAGHYDKNCKSTLFKKYFGRLYKNAYTMFDSALFYKQQREPNRVYEINPIYRYICERGVWFCERFFGFTGKNKEIGALLKTIDFTLRQKYNFKSTLKAGKITKLLGGMIQSAIERLDAKREREARAEIAIDASKLSGIRAAALATQEKLLIDEETEPEIALRPAPENAAGLSDAEREFVRRILSGQPYQGFLREQGVMLSVIIDSINEKLFGHFGDTVLIENSGAAEILEDYVEDLKECLMHK